MIDMTIDEAITLLKFNNKHIADLKNDDLQQIAEWLEELKANRIALEKANGYLEANYKLGYNKAIDDLLGGMNQITYNCQDADELFEKICDLAEQLKAGNSNERN